MKEFRNLYYTFEKDGNTVKSEKSFETLNLLRAYAKIDMQASKAKYATVYNDSVKVGFLEYVCGNLPVFNLTKEICHE